MQQAYIKATAEEKSIGKFFKDIALEGVVDFEAIEYAKAAGLTDPVFSIGKLQNVTL